MPEFDGNAAPVFGRRRPVGDTMSHGDRAYAFILAKLLDRTFVGHQTIDIDALVGELFMSRQPIRDALNRLAAEGFVVIVPQVGCVVASPSERDTQDAINLLRSCEVNIAGLAAVRRSEADLRRLIAIQHRSEELAEAGDVSAVEIADRHRELSRAFHQVLFDAIDSPSLATFAQTLQYRVEFMVVARIARANIPLKEPETPASRRAAKAIVIERNSEHLAIIDAVRASDADAAERVMHDHFLAGFGELAKHGAGAKREPPLRGDSPSREP